MDRATRLWRIERQLIAAGAARIAGVDEAGRGPLAGPVVAAAVILPVGFCPDGLNDSKQVHADARERLYDIIIAGAVAWAVAVISVEIIDEINILEATRRGMREALSRLSPTPDLALVDGLPLPDPPVRQHNVIKGDSHSASIAAASIMAKVTRDRLLCALDAEYPGYGFAQHKGYPTPDHLAVLRRLGPCPAHRRSFGPVQACGQGELDYT
ncbi:MAG: Ribonuclease HII [bacterium ADurb.Bin429]|nr:MAG: Ribonuclease HII [bacterium ADurb.Bin429]